VTLFLQMQENRNYGVKHSYCYDAVPLYLFFLFPGNCIDSVSSLVSYDGYRGWNRISSLCQNNMYEHRKWWPTGGGPTLRPPSTPTSRPTAPTPRSTSVCSWCPSQRELCSPFPETTNLWQLRSSNSMTMRQAMARSLLAYLRF